MCTVACGSLAVSSSIRRALSVSSYTVHTGDRPPSALCRTFALIDLDEGFPHSYQDRAHRPYASRSVPGLSQVRPCCHDIQVAPVFVPAGEKEQ